MVKTLGTGTSFSRLDRQREAFNLLYFEKELALRPVAEQLGVSVKMLVLWMDARGIQRRGRSQAQYSRSKKLGKVDLIIWLRLGERRGMEYIARKLGYASKGTVHNILASRGLEGLLSSLPTYEQYLRNKERDARKSTQADPADEEAGDTGLAPTGHSEP